MVEQASGMSLEHLIRASVILLPEERERLLAVLPMMEEEERKKWQEVLEEVQRLKWDAELPGYQKVMRRAVELAKETTRKISRLSQAA